MQQPHLTDGVLYDEWPFEYECLTVTVNKLCKTWVVLFKKNTVLLIAALFAHVTRIIVIIFRTLHCVFTSSI